MTKQLVVGMMTIVLLVSSCSDAPRDAVTPEPAQTGGVTGDSESSGDESSGVIDDPNPDTSDTQDTTDTGTADSPPSTELQGSDSSGDETATTSSIPDSSDLPEPGSGLTRPKSPNTTMIVPPPRD